jgi:hypothetical protein
MRGQSEPIRHLREALRNHAERRLGRAWAARSREIRALPAPDLPKAVARLLPPPAGGILANAWEACLQNLLQAAWVQVALEGDWRTLALLPPFPEPDPAPIPDPPIAPSPDLWLAWTCPESGRVEPLLVRSEHAPMAGECLEVRHEASGLLLVPTMVAAALSLETPATISIIRALHHHGGLWIDETALAS